MEDIDIVEVQYKAFWIISVLPLLDLLIFKIQYHCFTEEFYGSNNHTQLAPLKGASLCP